MRKHTAQHDAEETIDGVTEVIFRNAKEHAEATQAEEEDEPEEGGEQ